ncbi:MAG: PEP-CTERM sorting domain-containing protein [Phycisphaeraceae bacterium]
MPRPFVTLLTGIVTLTFLTTAQAQHSDLSPYVQDGQIHTGALPEGAGAVLTQDVRVFGYDFDLAPADFGTDDPGYLEYGDLGTLAGLSYLPAGTRLAYVVLDDLLYWDGSDDVAFGAVPAGTQLAMSLGGNPRVVGDGTGVLPPRLFVIAPGDGSMHVHVSSELQAPGTPGFPGTPADGIYLLQLQLAAVDVDNNVLTNPLASLPFWVVYNNGLDENVHDAAIDWVQGNLAPEPASLALLALGGAALLRRRR